jgi:hypothetical protein
MSESPTRYSYAVQFSETVEIAFPVLANFGWDGFWRLLYEKADRVIQSQADELLARGNITMEEARQLVEVERNGLVLQMREPLSPLGKFYSEVLKPANSLPSLESLLERKGSINAVLTSVGKARAVTNKIAFISRRAGLAGVVLQIVSIGVAIEKAPPGHGVEVGTEEVTGAALNLGVGTLGAWSGGVVAGATWAATVVGPSLVIPVIGEVTEGGAILIGGFAGGLFYCWLEHDDIKHVAHATTQAIWRLLPIEWTE